VAGLAAWTELSREEATQAGGAAGAQELGILMTSGQFLARVLSSFQSGDLGKKEEGRMNIKDTPLAPVRGMNLC
jgi:hypothetical protein